MYARVDDRILDELRAILGTDGVLAGTDATEPYSHDEVPEVRAEPEAVVKPVSAEQISAVFRLVRAEKIPVTPRGGGQGLSAGAVPVRGGIVLSLERMNRILEIDGKNLMATVEPGVITGDIHRAVEAEGLFYPPDPASLDSCTIGGNVAVGAGGPRAVKYGVTRDYVYGLEAVLPSGEVITCGGKLVKNATGYNLINLLIGSEGTLAVITKIVLRLLPLPPHRIDLLVPFDGIDAAAGTVADIIGRKVIPTAIEFMEADAIRACERLMEKRLPFSDAAAHLLIQCDGHRRESVEADAEQIGAICMANGAPDVIVAPDGRTRDRIWEARRLLLEAVRKESPVIHMLDVVVPRAAIPELLHGVREVSSKHGRRIISYGHAGDGNVHVNVLREKAPDDEWVRAVPEIEKDVYDLALSLGGMITGEHGVGAVRRKFLPRALGPIQVDLMRRLRAAFDPEGILNPGKIFP